ncbi:MAG: glycosyltransferase [Fibromonadaceae bacterium]|jgi:glycosyltransferase involved in cell wall biosynthesis|nr:glycosyltransferase [Fibromonadaceae bacterium]
MILPLKPLNGGDTRLPIKGRTVTSVFKATKQGPHYRPGNVRTTMLLIRLLYQMIINFLSILKLRKFYKTRKKNRTADEDISVIFYSDNLDEVNGIANSLRSVVPYLRAKGKKVQLWGSAFHTRTNGVVEDSFVVLFPRAASMEQLGYADSELAFPQLAPVLRFLKHYPADIMELETPSPGAWLVGIAARIAGLKVISHYRTDVPSYTRFLVKEAWMRRYVLNYMRIFYQNTTPVISPCETYREILETEIKVKPEGIKVLPRGIPLENFSPDYRKLPETQRNRKVRFIYVGRISVEKNIPFLEELWKQFCDKNQEIAANAELTIVGGGWYLETLINNMIEYSNVYFVGVRTGKELAELYANADFFLFPSGSDTFGNVVVESLASGTPVLVTDKGGPQDVIKSAEEKCGWVLPFENLSEWENQLKKCCEIFKTPEYEDMRKRSVKHSQNYTLEKMTTALWEFFKKL